MSEVNFSDIPNISCFSCNHLQNESLHLLTNGKSFISDQINQESDEIQINEMIFDNTLTQICSNSNSISTLNESNNSSNECSTPVLQISLPTSKQNLTDDMSLNSLDSDIELERRGVVEAGIHVPSAIIPSPLLSNWRSSSVTGYSNNSEKSNGKENNLMNSEQNSQNLSSIETNGNKIEDISDSNEIRSSLVEMDAFGFEGGEYYTDYEEHSNCRVPHHIQYGRELKWRDMLENWSKWQNKSKKLSERCRKSIPMAIRTDAWQCLVESPLSLERRAALQRDEIQQKQLLKAARSSAGLSSVGSSSDFSGFFSSRSRLNAVGSSNRRPPGQQIAGNGVLPSFVNSQPSGIPIKSNYGEVSSKYEQLYQRYLQEECDHQNEHQIRIDIEREFQMHYLLKISGQRHEAFFNILKAYSVRTNRPYTQGQTCLAGVMLMFMPELDAFWTFSKICEDEKFLGGIFNDNLAKASISVKTLLALLAFNSSHAYKFLSNNELDPSGFIISWFMSCYIRQIKFFPNLIHLLDVFFAEGNIILYKIGIYILTTVYGSKSAQKKFDPEFDLKPLREIPEFIYKDKNMVEKVISISLSESELRTEVDRQTRHYFEAKTKSASIKSRFFRNLVN